MGPIRRSATLDSQTSVTSVGSSIRSHTDHPELEWLAEDLQKELFQQQLVKDQTVRMRTIPKAFTGEDVVNILQQILQAKATEGSTTTTVTVSREEALEKGNDMMNQFSFFKHACVSTKPLHDSPTDCYQFDHNLPSQVKRVKSLCKSHWDKVRLLEKHIECKDRRHMFRIFPKCFVAREAVDVMMELKLVRSRKEAVHLMRRLNQKVFCCEHVTQEHDFKDEYLFFEFVPRRERMPEPSKRLASPKRTTNKDKKDKKDKITRSKSKEDLRAVTVSSSSSTHTRKSTDSNMSDEELKKVNKRKAQGIKNRLANYKQEMMMTKKKSNNTSTDEPHGTTGWRRLPNVAAA